MVRSFNQVRKSRKSAFTLIELLVVVLILGILLAVAIPLYLSSVKTSASRAVQANMRTIAQAGQALYVKTGSYPVLVSDVVGAGKDIEAISGPRAVTYTTSTVGAGPLVITATENGEDAFGTSATNETATFNLTTGAYSANLP